MIILYRNYIELLILVQELLKSAFIFRADTTVRTLCMRLSFAAYLVIFLSSSGRFRSNIHGKAYKSGGHVFEVNTTKYAICDYCSM